MGLLILKQNAVAEAEERVRGELLTELLVSTSAVDPSQRARAQARGVHVEALNALLVAESSSKPTSEITRRLHVISGEMGGLAGEHLGKPTLLIHSDDLGHTAQALHGRLRRELNTPVRLVVEAVDDQLWSRAFDLASRCCGLMEALGVTDQGSTADRYAMFAVLFDADRERDLHRFLADWIEPLTRHDSKRSTQLVLTLTTYFANAGNLTRTAAVLHIHMNTLLKRLERVEAILGTGWRDADQALQLHVALRLHELRSATSQP